MFNYPSANYYPQFSQQFSQQPTSDERIWVQNESSADAYLVAPNGFVRLWDANRNVFYEKRADATGRPLPIEVFEYAKKQRTSPIQPQNEAEGSIDWRKELDALNRRIEALEKERNDEQSNDDDSEVQRVSEQLSGESKGRSRKADCTR